MRGLFCAALLAAAACKTAEPVPEALSENFTPTGEIQFAGHGASFDDNRVVGPNVNMTRRTDGSWAGTMRGEPVDVSVYSSRVAGVDFNLSWERTDTGTVITGQSKGTILRFEVTGNSLLVRTGRYSVDMNRRDATTFGPNGEMTMKGDAGRKDPPMPQFGIAMAGAFLDPIGPTSSERMNPPRDNTPRAQ